MAEPIAVIGLDARLPCDGDSVEKFFEFLVAGRSAKQPIPKDRYNADAFWHPDNHRDGVIGGKEGHFMKGNIKAFDAPFFSMTPAEASILDPQQRLLLETSYTAMENAGYTMADMQGSKTGVYAGCFVWDYRDLIIKDVDTSYTYTGTGTIASTLAGRVSWFYDFRGPAFTVDTACSSSMVALHQAVVGLKSRDCDVALACGTNVILSPEFGLELNGLGVLSPASASKSFDKSANGYGRGEGIAAVVLKRMSDAIRDGDTIRAVIRNSGANHDGKDAGLTAPVRAAQADLMRMTYAQAKIDPSETRFFEAHGTGTHAGDPTEAGAISDMFSKYRSDEEPLVIGALKSNIGHTEGNSGIASLIKAVLCLESGIIPANAHFTEVNPAVKKEWHFKFPTKAMAYPKTPSGVRRVSINSFGVSGTNAHAVLEDALHFLKERGINAPHRTIAEPRLPGTAANLLPPAINGTAFSPQLFVLSAHDQDGIARLCKAYKEYLPGMTDSLYNLSYTLASKRTKFQWRTAVVASSSVELEEAVSEGLPPTRIAGEPGLGFVFTGQGAQWAQMGAALMHYLPYRLSLENADRYLKTIGCEWSVISEMSKGNADSRINDAEFSQALCTVLQVALVDLLNDWGVKPHAAAGHSSGEIAAAYSAGAISQECAWRIAFWRGKLSAQLARSPESPKAAMAAVGLTKEQALEYIEKVNTAGFESVGKLTVACENSKTSQTISGDAAQIDALVQLLNDEKVFARKLKVEMAYHSRYMEPIAKEYAAKMGTISEGSWMGQQAHVEFFSSTYGCNIEHAKLREAAYWTKNLVSTVRFNESMTAMLGAMTAVRGEVTESNLVTDIIEIGPHSALQGPLRNIIDDAGRGSGGVKYHSALKRGEPDVQMIMTAAGSLFSRGFEVDLAKVNHVENVKREMMIDLPRYSFNHSREYWGECRLSRNFRFRQHPRHELLGAPVNDWDAKYDAIWRNWIRLSENPWVEHHNVSGSVLYPAAGMMVMAIEGCKQLAQSSNPGKTIKGIRFREVSFHSALQVPDDSKGIESHLYLRPVKQAALETKASAWREFQVLTAQDDDQWREHCCGQVLVEYDDPATAVDAGREDQAIKDHAAARIADAQANHQSKVSPEHVYKSWADVGLTFGPTFQTVAEATFDSASGTTLATVKPTIPLLKTMMPHEYLQPHLIHPTTLDAFLQVCLLPLVSNPDKKQENAVVVSFIEEMYISAATHPEDGYLVFADNDSHGRKEHISSCTAVDINTREPLVRVSGYMVTEVDGGDGPSNSDNDPRHKAWKLKYNFDPEFLTAEEIARVFDGPDGFEKYLDALAHKNPQIKVLDISNGGYTFTNEVLSTLGSRYAEYDFTDKSVPPSEVQKSIKGDFVEFKALDVQSDPTDQGFELKSYDVLIAPVGAVPNAEIDSVLHRFFGLLKPGGKIILTVPHSTVVAKSWGKYLVKNGFKEPDALFGDKKSSILVSSVPSKAEASPASGVYYIVAPETHRGVADKLAGSFSGAKIVTIPEYVQSIAAAGQEALAESTCILLAELEKPLLTTADESVLSALRTMTSGKRLVWANTDSAHTDLVTGWAAAIRLEKPELQLVTITFQSEASDDIIASKISEIHARAARSEGTIEIESSYKIVDGLTTIPRLVEAATLTRQISQVSDSTVSEVAFGADPNRPLRLQIQQIGLLGSLVFTNDHLYASPLDEDEVELQVMATSVNFKDLAVMLGKINETSVGLESAGIITRVGSGVTKFKPGDRAFGFTYDGSFSTYARAWEGTLHKVPDNLSFAEAAIIPTVYTTAWACLHDIGELSKRTKRGMKTSVLIHAAAGGVGQATIQLAQREGAEIFVTVGSIEKRDFLEKTYGLPRDHIFSSRDLTFKDGVLRMTGGRGVDIVINSLTGDALRATWELVAPFGRFAEIGLSDIQDKSRISMGSFARCARIESFELWYMRKTDKARLDDLFANTMESIFDQNLDIKTPIKAFPVSRLEEAMRFMQGGKHIGKLVIEYHPEDLVRVVQPLKPAAKFAADATYLISGGLGGLGLEIIRWLVKGGAKHLIVPSRRGPADDAAKALVAEVQSAGVQIATPRCDVTDKAALEKAVAEANMPAIKGCIQAGAVFADNIFDQMTIDEWHKSVDVKVGGSDNLWEVISANGNTPDFFVMLSSIIGFTGLIGQTNYAAGNAYQSAMARHLASQGHNVVALNAPVLSDAGMVAEKPKLQEYLLSVGWPVMSTTELLNTLDYYCHAGGATPKEEAQLAPRLWLPQYSADEGADQPRWQHNPFFNHLRLQTGAQGGSGLPGGKQGSSKRSTSDLIAAAASLEEAETIVLEALLDQLTRTLSYELADLEPGRPLNAYGVDSLAAVELRVWMTKEIGADISVFEMTSGQRIGQLSAKAAAISRFLPAGLKVQKAE